MCFVTISETFQSICQTMGKYCTQTDLIESYYFDKIKFLKKWILWLENKNSVDFSVEKCVQDTQTDKEISKESLKKI